MYWASVVFRFRFPSAGEARRARPLQGHCGMTVALVGLGLISSLLIGGEVQAQSSQGLYWQCVPASSTHPVPGYCPVNSTYPLPVNTVAGGFPAAPISFQSKIAVTGTAVQLPSNALVVGLICFAKSANTATIEFGPSGVTNTVDGTGNGIIIAAGGGWSTAVSNSSSVYINGTAGDIVSCSGN